MFGQRPLQPLTYFVLRDYWNLTSRSFYFSLNRINIGAVRLSMECMLWCRSLQLANNRLWKLLSNTFRTLGSEIFKCWC